MTKKLELTHFVGKGYGYAEAVHGNVTMSILDNENKELCKPMHCKDFIQDAFAAELSAKPIGIYGFTWTPGTINVKDPAFRFSLRFANEVLAAKADANLVACLNAWEKKLGYLPLTEMFKTQYDNDRIIVSPAHWLVVQPIRVSLLTMLYRIGLEYNPGEDMPDFINRIGSGKVTRELAFSVDASYTKRCADRLIDIWKNKKWPDQTYKQYFGTTSALHHTSGVVSYLREATP
jgi:hypothetical protein